MDLFYNVIQQIVMPTTRPQQIRNKSTANGTSHGVRRLFWAVCGVQDYLLMDPRVREVVGDRMVNEMRQNIEIMLRKKKHAIQVRTGACTPFR